jgi:hypothetical protein
MSFPGNFFTPADQTIGNERAWEETSESSDSDRSGSTITRIVRANQSRAEEPETEKEETLEDLIDKGQILVDNVRQSGLAGTVSDKRKFFEGRALGFEKKAGTYGVPSDNSEEMMNLDDSARPRLLGPLKAKIRHKDYPKIWFCTTEVLRFLNRFEAAADGEGAEDSDKVRQVVNFIQDVEDMEGYGRSWRSGGRASKGTESRTWIGWRRRAEW